MPSHAGSSPVEPRLPVSLRWSEELGARLTEGMPATLVGQLALPAPLSRLLVLARSRPDAVSLAAVLVPTATRGALAVTPGGIMKQLGAIHPPETVVRTFRTRRQAGAIFVQDQKGQDRYLLATGLVNQLVVCCGTWPVLMPLIGPRVGAHPFRDRQALEADLDFFCHVVAVTLEGVYGSDKDSEPSLEVELELSSTGASTETATEALSKLGRSAVSLLRGGSLGRSPGAVYQAEARGGEVIGFDDIGGYDAAKAELEAICIAVREPARFRRWGARPPRGVLMFGPPGTGKTMLARALAHESGATFIHVRASDVVSKWYGEAEQKLQQAFDWASRERPSVLFFDEVDALARPREYSHEATHRIVSTFLENMDGLRELDGVVVVAATNRPYAVDEALTRPGRFDRLVEVPLPSPPERRAIFEVHLARAVRQARRQLFEAVDDESWTALLEASEGFSGADIAEVVRRALESRVRSGALDDISASELLASTRSVGRPW